MNTSSHTWMRFGPSILVAVVVGLLLGVLVLAGTKLPVRIAAIFYIGLISAWVGILSGNAKRFALSLLLLDLVIGLDVHIGHDATLPGNPNGVSLSLTTLSLVFLYAIWFVEASISSSHEIKLFPQVSLPALLLIGSGILSIVNANDAMFGLYEIVQLVEVFLIYFYIANHIKGRDEIIFVLGILFVGLFVESILVIMQYLTKMNFNLLLGTVRIAPAGGSIFRPIGTFGAPNALAGYVTPLLVICLGILLARAKILSKALLWPSFTLGFLALVVTFSRGGWLALAAGVLLLMLLNLKYRRLRISTTAISVGIAFVVLLISTFGGAIIYRLAHQHDALLARIPLMRLSVEMIKDHPFVGVGINNFGLVASSYLTPALAGAWLSTVHSKYLTIWAEMGTIGFIFFLWFLFALVREGFKCLRSNDRFLASLGLGLVAGLLAYYIHMMFDIFDQRSLVQLLWILAGLVTASGALSKASSAIESRGSS